MMPATCPLTVMLRKMPKMWSGKRGTMTVSMRRETMSRKSTQPFWSVSPGMEARPRPTTKESRRAVIMSITGGMATVK